MRLNVEMLEDPRGGRSVRTALYLHGAIAWPSGGPTAWSEALPEKLVDQEPRMPGAVTRPLANLDVVTPDDSNEGHLASLFETLGGELSASASTWVEHQEVAARFLLAARAEGQRGAILDELLSAARLRLRRRTLWAPLRILRLELLAFRGVERLTLDLSANQAAVLVGANGAGKTTLLDAMVLLLAHLEAGVRGASECPRELTDDDITNGLDATAITITAQMSEGEGKGEIPVTWSIAHTRGGEPPQASTRAGLALIDRQVARLRDQLTRGDVCLPIAVHYPVNRAVLDIPLRIRTTHPFEPIEAYDGALALGNSNFRLFFEWFREREDLENETRIQRSEHRDHQLEAVRRAIATVLPEVSGLRVQRAPLRMLVTKGEWTLYVDQLSDGEKCLLAMAGDLARRLAIANPFADDPLRGGGVIFIDEIELHLYPLWQRRIMPALELTFPRCQFIVTTHSPAVLGHVDHESVFILKPEQGGVHIVRPDVARGMDVNRILEDLLDVPARPEEFEAKLAEMHRRMDAGDTEGARALHVELAKTLGADDPALVKAEVLLRRREAARR